MKKLLLLSLLILTGCNDRFRYPCQDPKNWDTEDCKPPYCTARQECPEDLYRKEEFDEIAKHINRTSK